jgi:uncharacterized membrane protein YfcA
MLVFTTLPRGWTRVLIGLIATAFALNNLFGWARHRPPASASWPRGVVWSSVSGLTSFVAHAGGPPIMAYLLPQKLDRKVYVGTTVWFFFFSNYAKILPYAYLGQLDVGNLATALVLLPLVPVGVWLGVIVQGKLNEQVFYRISYWSMLAVGVKLLYDGVEGRLG